MTYTKLLVLLFILSPGQVIFANSFELLITARATAEQKALEIPGSSSASNASAVPLKKAMISEGRKISHKCAQPGCTYQAKKNQI